MALKSEQNQLANLLQAIHGFIANAVQSPQPFDGQPGAAPAGYAQGYGQFQPQPGAVPQQPGTGGFLGNFLNSGFGRALETGAGFGIGDELISEDILSRQNWERT